MLGALYVICEVLKKSFYYNIDVFESESTHDIMWTQGLHCTRVLQD